MRTTEAARYARWSLTLAAMLAITVAGVYAHRAWEARRAQQAAPPPVPAAVQQRSQEFTFSKVTGNDTRFIVRAAHATEFKEGGRTLLEDVWITTFGGSGERADQLHTQSCEYLAQTGVVTCPGEVRIDLQGKRPPGGAGGMDAAASDSGAVHIVTSRLRFSRETGMASSDEPVQFRFPQGEGHAVGLTYDSERGELHLLRQVEIVLRTGESHSAPSETPGGAPMSISSGELAYRRDERLIHLTGPAILRHGRQELQAGRMVLELDGGMRATRLVARDQPVLHSPGAGSDVSLSAEELEVLLETAGRPQRVIASRSVVLKAVRADGGHELTGDAAALDLVPESQQARQFTASGNVMVRSGLRNSSMRHLQASQLALFFVSEGQSDSRVDHGSAEAATIEWENPAPAGSPGGAEGMRLSGRSLQGWFDGAGVLRELRGSGGVEVQKRAAGEAPVISASRELLARMLPDGTWSTIDQSGAVRLKNAAGDAQAERARFERAADTVTLAGAVILTDVSSQTRAQTATFRQGAGELRAEGSVSTTERSQDSEPAHISSERMMADSAAGRAVYSGKARLWQGNSVIQADTIEFDRSRRVMTASGHVNAVFPQSRGTGAQSRSAGPAPGRHQPASWRAQAGRMVYEEEQGRARLERGAYAQSAEGSIRADRIDIFFASGADSGSPRGGLSASSGLGASLEGQEVQRAQGVGNVRVESAGRTGTGEQADYWAAESKFILSGGRPKLIDEFGNSTAGRQLTFFFSDDRILVDSEEGSRTLTLHRVEK